MTHSDVFRDIKDKNGNLMWPNENPYDYRGITSVEASPVSYASSSPWNRWCIAVLDESSMLYNTASTTYATFRSTWPNRKLFLLVPASSLTQLAYSPGEDWQSLNNGNILIPQNAVDDRASGLFTGPTRVNRDEGVVGNLSDWFTITGMSALSAGSKVGLFVDNSGSMYTSTVQASYDKFVADVAAAGIDIITVTNIVEDWITPFISMPGI
jgi:hypothetical protein